MKMSDQSILEELEDEFEIVGNDSWEPDFSFSGSGNYISETFESPGGFVIIEVILEDDSYDITAVGESEEDLNILYQHEPSVDCRKIRNMDQDTYILDIETESGGSWEVNFYFTAPEPATLPISKSGSGDDFIGPLNHSGFIQIEAKVSDNHPLEVFFVESHGNTYMGDQVVRLDGVNPSEDGSSIRKVASNQDSHKHKPWVRVDCDGEWELELTPHN